MTSLMSCWCPSFHLEQPCVEHFHALHHLLLHQDTSRMTAVTNVRRRKDVQHGVLASDFVGLSLLDLSHRPSRGPRSLSLHRRCATRSLCLERGAATLTLNRPVTTFRRGSTTTTLRYHGNARRTRNNQVHSELCHHQNFPNIPCVPTRVLSDQSLAQGRSQLEPFGSGVTLQSIDWALLIFISLSVMYDLCMPRSLAASNFCSSSPHAFMALRCAPFDTFDHSAGHMFPGLVVTCFFVSLT